ncbi:MAG: hypothetical protein N3G75_06810, partial [Methanothrix sp.]
LVTFSRPAFSSLFLGIRFATEALSSQVSRLGALGEALSKFKSELTGLNLALTGFAAVSIYSAASEEEFRAEIEKLMGTDAASAINSWIDAAAGLAYTNKGARAELAATLAYMGLTGDQIMTLGDNLERLAEEFPSVGRSAKDIADMMKIAISSGDPKAWERLNRVLGDYRISQEDIEREYYRLISAEKDLDDVRLEELRQTAAINVLNAALSKRLEDVKSSTTTTADRIKELKNRLEDLVGDIGSVLIPGFLVVIGVLQALIKVIQAIPYGEQFIGIGVAVGILTTAAALALAQMHELYTKLLEIPGIQGVLARTFTAIQAGAVRAAAALNVMAARAATAFRSLAASAVAALRSIYVSLGPIGIALIALGAIVALVVTHWEEFHALAERLGLARVLEAVIDAGKRLLGWISAAIDRFGGWKNVLLILLGPLGAIITLISKLVGLRLPELELKIAVPRLPAIRLPELRSAIAQTGFGLPKIKLELPAELRGYLSVISARIGTLAGVMSVITSTLSSMYSFLVGFRDIFMSRWLNSLMERSRGLVGWVVDRLSSIYDFLYNVWTTKVAPFLDGVMKWLEKINEGVWGYWNKPVEIKYPEGWKPPAKEEVEKAAEELGPLGKLHGWGETTQGGQPVGTKEWFESFVPEATAQVGARVERTGLALVHTGEEIVPADLVRRVGDVRRLLEEPITEGAPLRPERERPATAMSIHMPIDIRIETRREVDPYRLRVEIEDIIRRTFRQYQT